MAMLNLTTKKIELRKNSAYSLCREASFDISAPSIHAPPAFDMDEAAEEVPERSPSNYEDAHFLLNVGGKSFRFRQDVILTCREESLLSTLIRAEHSQRLMLTDSFNEETGEYYVERNFRVASHIIDYYVTGKLHKPSLNEICPERFTEELQYWRLYNVQFAPCCGPILNTAFGRKDLTEEEHEFDGTCCSTTRLYLWRAMEDPSSSYFSKIFSIVSISFIFASIVGLILGSMPEFQMDTRYAQAYHIYHQRQRHRTSNKFDEAFGEINLASYNLTGYVYKPTDNPAEWLVFLEYVCILWFTIEYVLRFMIAPRKKKFMLGTMNLIDLLTIAPVYMEFLLAFLGIYMDRLKDFTAAVLVLRVLRVLRMARVFKLARYSSGLQIFGNTLRASMTELSMLLIFLVTGTVFFSTLMYLAEKDEPYSDFTSIPAACWWCIITITTVGFGDCHVQTTLGKVVATAASITGIILLAFPVSLIVENFAQAQHQSLIETQIRQSQISSIANNYTMKRGQSRRRRPEGDQKANLLNNRNSSVV
ncbi:Potassium voltage-gated channel subfamily B member 1 [Aphelenchoides bicaudatus]|nr:Potassium voltage-gated channel subfamily B member 1 [Aphelenchoides bicaudatus]